jgi:hypothetical protein
VAAQSAVYPSPSCATTRAKDRKWRAVGSIFVVLFHRGVLLQRITKGAGGR